LAIERHGCQEGRPQAHLGAATFLSTGTGYCPQGKATARKKSDAYPFEGRARLMRKSISIKQSAS